MSEKNKELLKKGNAAVAEGNYEAFLSLCSHDTEWNFVGEQTLKGKEAVRQYMADNYLEPPKVMVDDLIAEEDMVTAIGTITMKNKDGTYTSYSYCDVWRFRDGKMVALKAFVIKN